MNYELTDRQKTNRKQLQIISQLVRFDPSRFKASLRICEKGMIFDLFDNNRILRDYRVVIQNKPNNFPWKWLNK